MKYSLSYKPYPKRTHFLILFVYILLTGCSALSDQWTLTSPNGSVNVNISIKKPGGQVLSSYKNIYYSINYITNGVKSSIVLPSLLGIHQTDVQMVENLKFVSCEPVKRIDDAYTMRSGKRSSNYTEANELVLTFKNRQKIKIQLVLRAYDSGVAFQYRFPENPSYVYSILKEELNLAFDGKFNKWLIPANDENEKAGIQQENASKSELSSYYQLPALFEVNKHWLLVSESGINSFSIGSHLQYNRNKNRYTFIDTQLKSSSLPQKNSSWRVFMIGESLGSIVESTLVTDLSEPSEIENDSWILPGRALWYNRHNNFPSTGLNSLQRDIDLASEEGLEYVIVNSDILKSDKVKVESVINYALQKGVGIFASYEHSEMAGMIFTDLQKCRNEIKILKLLGVKGIKLEYDHNQNHYHIQIYQNILREAAQNKMLIVLNGSEHTGSWNRTWPNLLSSWGECNTSDTWLQSKPQFITLFPFTRNVVGSMDYVSLHHINLSQPDLYSIGNKLAVPVIFESGIAGRLVNDLNFLHLKPSAVKITKEIPASWDEIKFISGHPDSFIILARRKGNTWYVAGINSGANRTAEFKLPFIEKGKTMELLCDATDEGLTQYQVFQLTGDNISIPLLKNGGFLGRIKL